MPIFATSLNNEGKWKMDRVDEPVMDAFDAGNDRAKRHALCQPNAS